MNEMPSPPRWETAVMVGSFALIWIYFLQRHAILEKGGNIPVTWHGALLLAVGALIIVFVRRLKRTLDLLKKTKQGKL